MVVIGDYDAETLIGLNGGDVGVEVLGRGNSLCKGPGAGMERILYGWSAVRG